MDESKVANLAQIGVAFDTETWLITSKCAAPPIVCASIATKDGAGILNVEDARATFERLLQPGVVIIGAYIAYDMIVMAMDFARRGIDLFPRIFAKYDAGEVWDVQIAEMLDAIAGGYLGRDPRDGGTLRDPASGKQVHRYRLDVVTDHVLGRSTAKENDYWRLRYYYLRNVPIDQWPTEARQYPVDDAVNTREVALAQAGITPRGDGTIARAQNTHAVVDICRASFALSLGAAWGFATDGDRIDELEEETKKNIEEGRKQFEAIGLIRADGSKDTGMLRRMVVEAYGGAMAAKCPACEGSRKVPSEKTGKPINCKACGATGYDLDDIPGLPRTEKGSVMTARDILVDCGDDTLRAFGDWGEDLKTLQTYVPALREGVPLRPNVPLANERVSYSGIVQTMPRKASARGQISVRECVVARPGYVLGSVDFAGVEMATWAQCCIWIVGYSKLSVAINSGKDAHSILGADLCGITYEAFIEGKKAREKKIIDFRQAAKAGNFTFAGGGGEVSFVLAKRKEPGMTTTAPDGYVYKGTRFCVLIGGKHRCGETMITEWKGRPTPAPVCLECVQAAARIRDSFRNRWTEANEYYAHVNQVVENVGFVKHFGSGVIRGGVEYTQAANTYFSSLMAYGAKRALWRVTEEAYTDRSSALWGTRPIGFIHDEIIAEIPEDRAHDAAYRMAEVMVDEMQLVVPDVKINAEPALMRRLYKGAEPVFEDEKLVPWKPK